MENFGHIYRTRTRQGKARYVVDLRPVARIYKDAEGNPLTRKKDAERILHHLREEVWRGRVLEDVLAPYLPAHADPLLVESRLEAWLALKRRQTESGEMSPGTLREYERYARPDGHFSWWYGKSVLEIDYGRVEDWNVWLASRGIAPKTRFNVVAAFHSFVTWLYKRNEIRQVPSFDWPRPDEYQPTIIPPETQDAILDAIPEDSRGIFLAMFLMGVRPGEARALDCGDLHTRGRTLTVSKAVKGRGPSEVIRGTKTRKARSVPVHPDLDEWISRNIPKVKLVIGDAPLFVNPRTGRRWKETAIKRVFYKARGAAGAPAVSLYEAGKHSMATEAYARIGDERVVQEMLGHADARSTRRYAQLQPAALVQVLRPRGAKATDP
jgi:integrase